MEGADGGLRLLAISQAVETPGRVALVLKK